MKKKDKISIYTFFTNIPTFIYLLPMPVLQNILFDPANVREYITSYALSIMLFAAGCVLFAADYRAKRYKACPEYTLIREGIFLRSQFILPYRRLQTVILESSPLSLIFGAVRVQLNTSATKARKGDAGFYISKNSAGRLIEEIYDDIGDVTEQYKAKNRWIFFMSAIWSNPVSGLLLLLPIVRNTGKIIGEQLRDELIRDFDLSQYLLYIGISPATAFIVYFMLVCYAASVCADFFKTANFECTSYDNGMIIKRGILKRRLLFTHQSKLNAITLSRSIFMIPFGRYSAYIHTTGAGSTKSEISLLIAAEKKESVKSILLSLFPDMDLNFEFTVRPIGRAVWSYIMLPVVLIICDIVMIVVSIKSGLLFEKVLYLQLTLFPILTILLWFDNKAFKTSSVSVNNRYVYVRSYKRVTLNSTLIPLNKIQLCVKRVNLFQKISHTCNLRIYIYGEKQTFVEIKQLNNEAANSLIKLLGIE